MRKAQPEAAGVLVNRRKDGSIRLRRKGTVVFAWMAIVPFCPGFLLLGIAGVEQYGFRGVGGLYVMGMLILLMIRACIRPCIVLEADGSIRNIGPLLEVTVPMEEGISVRCENNGLMIVRAKGESGVWSFSQSRLGGRSAHNARKFIARWLKERREPPPGRGSVGRNWKVHFTFVDVLLLVGPWVVPVIMAS
ncbi:hypothetical protein F610DRAFT_06911 [Streptomyces sp. LaPpAH-199]|uniref:hypothetical protein n=1 Tax=Streptomyces TaxID=1883 RepID=UPI000891E531|nr:hypothetical protein [Streptomyces sp. LaPpAH-199]MYW83125.1 hypothetical protein [Streptomyces sp. SID8369]SDE36028.1 hypothetical protein F610DRAFT_06911 [Streptomyces sp. LaPpAH-199]